MGVLYNAVGGWGMAPVLEEVGWMEGVGSSYVHTWYCAMLKSLEH